MFSQLKIYPPETTKGKGLSILTLPILLLVSVSSGFVGYPDTQMLRATLLLARLIVDI